MCARRRTPQARLNPARKLAVFFFWMADKGNDTSGLEHITQRMCRPHNVDYAEQSTRKLVGFSVASTCRRACPVTSP